MMESSITRLTTSVVVVALSYYVTFRNVTTTITKDYPYLHPDK